jgi:hypothetical protein
MSGADGIFTRDGAGVVATRYAAGPWHRDMQHGGAPSALVAWAAEQVAVPVPMRTMRVTVELLRPVPVGALTIDTQVVRQGRKIQVVQVRLLADGVEVTRGMVLRVRIADTPLPEGPVMPAPTSRPEDAVTNGLGFQRETVGFADNFEMRRQQGGIGQVGPGQAWFRQHRALIAGEPLSPLVRAMTVADFSNGIAPALPFADWTFLNADLSVSLAREPEGEWIFSDAETWAGEDGTGLAMTRLADRRGYFGRAVQSLLLEPR